MTAYSTVKPGVLENKGKGKYLYRWDIEEVKNTDEDGNESTQYKYEKVELYAPLSMDKIVRKVITSLWDNDHEQKLINSYNTVVLGIDNAEETNAVKEYEEFLTQRAAIRKQVHSDCEALGIK